MADVGMYECGSNFFFHNVLWSSRPGVPVSKNSVLALANHVLWDPCRFPWTLEIQVPDGIKYDPLKHCGSWKKANPEEFGYAVVLAIARDIERGLPAAVLEQWKYHCLTSTVLFDSKLETETDLYFRQANLREIVASEYPAVAPTAYQRITELQIFKEKYEATSGKLSNKMLHEKYVEKVKVSEFSEPVSESMVDNCMTVQTRAFVLPPVRAAVEWAENEWGMRSPFNSISKLQALVQKAKTPQHIKWTFIGLKDLFRSKVLLADDLRYNDILGKNAAGISIVTVFVKKLELNVHFLTKLLDGIDIDQSIKAIIREKYGDHASYRAHVQAYPDQVPLKLAWARNFPVSANLFTNLMETLVYGRDHDGMIKSGIKARKSAEEIMEYTLLAEKWVEIEKAVETEKAARIADTAGKSDIAGTGTDSASAGASGVTNSGGGSSADTGLPENDNNEDKWLTHVNRIILSRITLMSCPATENQLADNLKETFLVDVSGTDGHSHLGVFWQTCLCGEPVTSPHLRPPPVRPEWLQRLVGGVVKARGSDPIKNGDIYIFIDCAKTCDPVEREREREIRTYAHTHAHALSFALLAHIPSVHTLRG